MSGSLFWAVYILFMVSTSLLIVQKAVRGIQLSRIIKLSMEKILFSKIYYYLIPMFLVILIAWVEIKLESFVAVSLSRDFTAFVAHMEGNIVKCFQQVKNLPLTYFFSYFYIIVWPSLVVSSIIVYTYFEDIETLKKLVKGYVGNLFVALPFYLFFPVKESWTSGVGIRLLLNDISPKVTECLRPLSGINNCFPSFHVSLSFTVVFVALFSGYRRLGGILAICAGVITFSTFYLGIHWLSDAIGGIILACLLTFLLFYGQERPCKISSAIPRSVRF